MPGENPSGFQLLSGRECDIGASCVGGWEHELAQKCLPVTESVWSASFGNIALNGKVSKEKATRWVGKNTGVMDRRPESEDSEVVISKGGHVHVPDHLSRRRKAARTFDRASLSLYS